MKIGKYTFDTSYLSLEPIVIIFAWIVFLVMAAHGVFGDPGFPASQTVRSHP